MRTRELIKLLPTQFKRIPENPLYSGHYIPHLCYWNKDEGFVKVQELEYNNETLACPIIAVVNSKIGGQDLKLTITAKTSVYDKTTEKTQDGYTLKRKIYKDSGETIQATLTIPRFTRQYATFLITGLGKNVWAISSITADPEDSPGSVDFYALASNGSKLIYWLGIHNLVEELKQILRPWIAPTICVRCGGTGKEPDSPTEFCKDCNGYKYAGYSAVKSVQRKIGFDLNLSRELLDWDNLTDDDHKIIKKFINKCWTQKWWVTPTKKEIKRFFAHFYQVSEDDIIIEERFNLQEPLWRLLLPQNFGSSSPFKGSSLFLSKNDIELIKYIGESLTPIGVSLFVGFYNPLRDFGNFRDISDEINFKPLFFRTSMISNYAQFGFERWDYSNGWTKATDDFEREDLLWESSGSVEIYNANDMNRHMARLSGDCYMETGISMNDGTIDVWVHPISSEIRIGIRNNSDWLFYVEYDSNGFYDNNGFLITMAKQDNDYHLSIDFDNTSQTYDVLIQQQISGTGIAYLNSGNSSKLRIESVGSGIGFVDAVGIASGDYSKLENYSRIGRIGYGINNDFYVGSGDNKTDIITFLRRDRFWNLNDY